MISLTRLNGKTIVLNALLIESIEETPDTIITLTTGKRYTVLEKADDVVAKVRDYMQNIGLVQAAVKSTKSEGT